MSAVGLRRAHLALVRAGLAIPTTYEESIVCIAGAAPIVGVRLEVVSKVGSTCCASARIARPAIIGARSAGWCVAGRVLSN